MRRRLIRYWLPVVLWATLIFLISSLPGSVLEDVQTRPTSFFLRFLLSDPVGHFMEFSVLAFLLNRAFRASPLESVRRKSLFLAFTVGVFFALSNELYQLLIPHRGFEVYDLFMGILGVSAIGSCKIFKLGAEVSEVQ